MGCCNGLAGWKNRFDDETFIKGLTQKLTYLTMPYNPQFHITPHLLKIILEEGYVSKQSA